MIRNQWYSVLESSEVGSHPVGVTRMGERLVFWRSEEGISCLRDQCVHRGAALSAGKIVDGEVQCPFHGLRYDSTGRVTLIPANGKSAKVPDYFKVNAYPARDEHGFIWIWWGEAKETYPKIPWFEDIDTSSHQARYANTGRHTTVGRSKTNSTLLTSLSSTTTRSAEGTRR